MDKKYLNQVSNNNCVNILDKKFYIFINEWLKHKKYEVKETSYVKYNVLANNHIIPYLGDMELSKILDTKILDEFIFQKSNNGKLNGNGGLSKSTINSICVILNSIFDYINHNYIQVFQKYVYQLPRKKTISLTKTIPNDECNLMINYLKQNFNSTYNLGILICLFTGIRLGEICALKWSDIDLEHEILSINKTTQRIKIIDNSNSSIKTKLLIDTPKSISSIRIIPIPKLLVNLLKKYRLLNKDSLENDMYFLSQKKEKCCEPRTYQYYFKRLLVNKLNICNYKFHCLRHTFASRYIELGFDIKSLSEILGHSSVNITLNIYVHTSIDYKKKQINKFDY